MYEFTPFDIMQRNNIKSIVDGRRCDEYQDFLQRNHRSDVFTTLDHQLLHKIRIFQTDAGEYYGYYLNADRCFHTSNKCTMIHVSTPDITYVDQCYVERYDGVVAIFNNSWSATFLDTLVSSERYAPPGMKQDINDKCWFNTPLLRHIAASKEYTLDEFIDKSALELLQTDKVDHTQVSALCGIHAGAVTIVEDTEESLWIIHDARKFLDTTIDMHKHTVYTYDKPTDTTTVVFDESNVPRTWVERYCGFIAVCWLDTPSIVWHDKGVIVAEG